MDCLAILLANLIAVRLQQEFKRKQRMSKKHLNLQPSEAAVFSSAAQIYSAYIVAGKVSAGEEDKWMARSIKESIKLALATEDAVVSDEELN